jgi:type II secretory pathway pseudopilin PulG
MKSFSDSTSGTFAKFVFKLHSYVRTIRSSHLPTIQNKKLNIQNLRTIPLTPSPLNPLIPRRLPAAFSLTEVVIAMGVAAVAFTSIIALFPLGLNMSKESYEETQAALLAQTILADFRDNLTGSAATAAASGGGPTSGFLIQVSSNNSPINFTANNPINYTNILAPPTTTPTTIYIAYNQQSQSDTPNGEIMLRPFKGSSSAADFYTQGTNNAVAIAKITIRYCFPGLLNGTLTNGPCQIDIAIETPGNLPTEKRKQLLFTGGVN